MTVRVRGLGFDSGQPIPDRGSVLVLSRHLRVIGLAAVALVFTVSCKKPQLEIEEEGPPLPLDPRTGESAGGAEGGPSGGPEGGPARGSEGAPEGSPIAGAVPAPRALTVDDACALVDAHFEKELGRDLHGRQCFGLRPDGAGYRLQGYLLAETPDPVAVWTGLSPCFWPLPPDSPEAQLAAMTWELYAPPPFRFAYADSGGTACRTEQEYCSLGAPGARLELGATACSGDEALWAEPAGSLATMVGDWVPRGDRLGKLTVGSEGQVAWAEGEVDVVGSLRTSRQGNGVVVTDQGGITVGWALIRGKTPDEDKLYFGLGDTSHTRSETTFTAMPRPERTIRRFADQCWDVTAGTDVATLVRCSVIHAETTIIALELGEERRAYARVEGAWLSSGVYASAWRRATTVSGGTHIDGHAKGVPEN